MKKSNLLAIFSMIITALFVMSLVNPIYAVEKTREVTNAYLAQGRWTVNNSDGTTTVYDLFASKAIRGATTMGGGINVATFDADGSLLTFLIGTIEAPESAFIFDKKLASASLSPVTIELRECEDRGVCPVVGSIVVSAEWTGIGVITESKSKGILEIGSFTLRTSQDTTERGALATGTFDGTELNSDDANLTIFKGTTVEKTK